MYAKKIAALGAVASLAAGCGSGSTGSVTTPRHNGNIAVVRGTTIASYSCAAADAAASPAVASVNVSERDITAIRVCPLPHVPVADLKGTYTVHRADPIFQRLVRTLSAPDQTAKGNIMCPAYAELAQPVIASTISGPILIHIPVDSCHHYLAPAMSALRAVRTEYGGMPQPIGAE